MRQVADKSVDDILRDVVAGTAAVIGEEFFRELVRHLALSLGVRWALVAELAGSRKRVRTLAFWSPDGFSDGIEYDVADTPCEQVLTGETRLYAQNVAALFPHHPELAEMGAESYLAMPLIDSHREVIGHLAVIDDKPFFGEPSELSVFQIFGSRVAAELERRNVDQALHLEEARLTAILDTATDAIVTIDADRHITMFNRSAEKTFGCAAAWAIGQPFDRFLSRRFRHLLESCLGDLGVPAPASSGQVWAPQGITARRADGKEFPVELTVSKADAENGPIYTMILRDLGERQGAERRLKQLMLEKEYLREEAKRQSGATNIVSISAAMRTVLMHVDRVAVTDSTVLLTGETGVGKELVAWTLHSRSRRSAGPMIKLNCAALPGELIETELFGHEKGAFSGASARRIGRFELANGGTLLLDEVGELSQAAQAKLLRVLQEQAFERVGGAETIRTDARVIAATNRNLEELVRAGTFREDLYYRLNVFPIWIPPLRERPDDIPVMAQAFLEKLAHDLGKDFEDLSPASLQRLKGYRWPGNARELQNVIERAAILADGPVVEVPEVLAPCGGKAVKANGSRTLREAERECILSVLDETAWQIEGAVGAAALLGLAPSTLRSSMRRLGIARGE